MVFLHVANDYTILSHCCYCCLLQRRKHGRERESWKQDTKAEKQW